MSAESRLSDENDAHACDCGHSVWWHHERRGCGYHGYAEEHRCTCRLMAHEAVAAVVTREKAQEREVVVREFEALADFWALSKGWVGPVALHDFRRKIDTLRLRPEMPSFGGDA